MNSQEIILCLLVGKLTLGVIGTTVEGAVLAVTLHQSATTPMAFALFDSTFIMVLIIINIIKM